MLNRHITTQSRFCLLPAVILPAIDTFCRRKRSLVRVLGHGTALALSPQLGSSLSAEYLYQSVVQFGSLSRDSILQMSS